MATTRMDTATEDLAERTAGAADGGSCPLVRRGRPAAGEDPVKRARILAGAERVFNSMGFDAASMNDITREAGVSKATVYVYFSSKEELFAELIDSQRRQHRDELIAAFQSHPDVEGALTRLGSCLAEKLTADWSLSAQRIVLGVTNRMPAIGRRFYEGGAGFALAHIEDFLRRRTESGELAVPDPELAANQFLDLCVASFLRTRLYAARTDPPDAAEIARVVGGGVRVFLEAYRPKG